MELVDFGGTGVTVSRLCLGTAAFGSWGALGRAECAAIVARSLDAGINFIDTADVYSAGEAERILGRVLAGGRRSEVVLSTKVGIGIGADDGGKSRDRIVAAVEGSLRRLETEWVDVCHLHRPDPSRDIAETLAALEELVVAGKVRHVGTSNFQAYELVEAQVAPLPEGRARPVCEQPSYSVFTRTAEREVLPVCQKYGLAALAWSPLAGGWLSGKYRRRRVPAGSRRHRLKPERFDFSLPDNQRKLAAIERLDAAAAEAGIDLIGLALGFVLEHPAVTSMVIGPRTGSQLESYLDSYETRLGERTLDEIDAIVAPGTAIADSEAAWQPPAIADKAARRRGLSGSAAT